MAVVLFLSLHPSNLQGAARPPFLSEVWAWAEQSWDPGASASVASPQGLGRQVAPPGSSKAPNFYLEWEPLSSTAWE